MPMETNTLTAWRLKDPSQVEKAANASFAAQKNRARPPPGRCRPSQPQKPRMCASGVGQPFAAQKARMCASGEGSPFTAQNNCGCRGASASGSRGGGRTSWDGAPATTDRARSSCTNCAAAAAAARQRPRAPHRRCGINKNGSLSAPVQCRWRDVRDSNSRPPT